jgi:hypothetical protein
MLYSDSLIKALDALYESRGTTRRNGRHTYDRHYNPTVEIITHEWFHSDSCQILDTISMSWEQLDKSKLIHDLVNDLNCKDYRHIGKSFEKDFCCWYQSYHYLPRKKWGVHLRYDSILAIASDLSRKKKKASNLQTQSDIVKHAILYLCIHCFFHYLLENAVGLMELISDTPSLYANYISNVYVNVFNTADCLEEALANRYMLDYANECRIDRKYLQRKLSLQSDGYRNFMDYYGKNFQYGKRRLLSQIKNCTLNPPFDSPIEQILDQRFSNTNDMIDYGVPIWLHYAPLPLHHLDNN